jgi:hypothetical protein
MTQSCASPRVPQCILCPVHEFGIIDRATGASSSRAGPRRNVGSNYARPATRQRRITACVMRPFGRGLPHTLPFPAHPRVCLRSKKAVPAVATLFGLPATLRAGTPEFNNGTPEAIYGGRSSRIAVAARGTFSEERFGRRVVGGM